MKIFSKKIYPLLFLTFLFFLMGNIGSGLLAQTTIEGKITDKETGEELIGANVIVKKNGVYVNGASADLDGNFSLNVDPNTYDVEVTYTGFIKKIIKGVPAIIGQATKVDVQLTSGEAVEYLPIGCGGWILPLNKQDETSSGETKTSEQIRNLPIRNIQEIISTTAGTTFQ